MQGCRRHLFLLSGKLLSLQLSPLLSLADQASIATSDTQLPVRALFALVVCDLALLNCRLVASDREVLMYVLHLVVMSSVTMRLGILSRSLTLLRVLRVTREDDETCFVGFEAFDVGGERFFRDVLASRVDGDADCWSQLAWDAGFLQVV